MPYYTRIFGTRDPDIHLDELFRELSNENLVARLELDPSEKPEKWSMLEIANEKGEALAQVERNPVVQGELGQEELDEFRDQIKSVKPASAVKWLTSYFEKVKVIYAFQMLNAAYEDENSDIVPAIKYRIWKSTGGLLQADGEGFSNEQGYHILWQFADNVSGEWRCAVRNWMGNWKNFILDLGDPVQRQEFQDGKVPGNARAL
jgi:hypothetical protein